MMPERNLVTNLQIGRKSIGQASASAYAYVMPGIKDATIIWALRLVSATSKRSVATAHHRASAGIYTFIGGLVHYIGDKAKEEESYMIKNCTFDAFVKNPVATKEMWDMLQT